MCKEPSLRHISESCSLCSLHLKCIFQFKKFTFNRYFFFFTILCIPFLSLLAPIICKLNILNLILALTVSLELLSKIQFSVSDF